MDVAAIFRSESSRARAGLARPLGDLDRADDAVADAFVLALERWPHDGVPADPGAWIALTARNRAIDRIRRDRRGIEKHELLARLDIVRDGETAHTDASPFGDDRLELLFGCIHPALDRNAQVALTLRALGGLSTDEIADAFFIERAALQQRIVRAKNKIRTAGIPFVIPPPERLGERLDALAAVIYLIFTAGYAPSRGTSVIRVDLCESAIEIGTLVAQLLPDRPEPHALEALMRFHHARRATRADAEGDIVLLAEQDRTHWDTAQIARASAALRRALTLPSCSLTYEAYIAAAHAHAPSFEETDWDAIVAAYDTLLALHGEVARARTEIDAIAGTPEMCRNRYYDVACARTAYERALGHATEERDRRVIARRLKCLAGCAR
ncbi:MAG: sigma-70 family RNA polymerase sigma factor [Candidatus Velthaea sp.]